jgi:hypothetical protein
MKENNLIPGKIMNLNEAIKIIQKAKVSHNIDLGTHGISAQGAKNLAKQLKDSKVSHTINLERNSIGAPGISALENMIKNSKFPSYIILGGNELDAAMQNNDAILAIQNPKIFESKIKNIFTTSLPALAFRDLPEDLNNIIIRYIGQQETNHMNLQYLQDLRIRALKNQMGKEITPADANYAIKNLVPKHYDEKELGGEGIGGLKIIEIERILEEISDNDPDTGIKTNVDHLGKVLEHNQQNHLYTYVIDTMGEDSRFKQAIQQCLKNKEEYHALEIQKDGSTCGDNSLIVLSELRDKFKEKEGVGLGISYVSGIEGNHAVIYMTAATRDESTLETIKQLAISYSNLRGEETKGEDYANKAIGGVVATKQLLENYTIGDVGKTYYESASLVLGAFYVGKIATQLAALSKVEIETPDLGSNSFFGDNFVNDLL